MKPVFCTLVVLVALAGCSGVETRSKAINTGDYYDDLAAVPTGASEFAKVGYHYKRFGVMGLDIWRWGGEYVLYNGLGHGSSLLGGTITYVVITQDEAATLGVPVSVPWRYYLPPGLIVVLGLLELAIAIKLRPSVRATLIIAIALAGVAACFVAIDLVPEVMVPGFLGAFHLVGAWTAYRRADDDDESSETAASDAPAKPLLERPPLPSPPRVETDPFRAPPQPAPLRIAAPVQAHPPAPITLDADAEKPKILL